MNTNSKDYVAGADAYVAGQQPSSSDSFSATDDMPQLGDILEAALNAREGQLKEETLSEYLTRSATLAEKEGKKGWAGTMREAVALLNTITTPAQLEDKTLQFCVDVATSLYSSGFADWLNGLDEPKEHQGKSYYTGFNEAKKMHPGRF